ncbi:hypothetical protein J7T55_015530 [Diaporthe amygdali]|uniref:uncharacterized protein n=1 Tax=Phomopsis amygdali TaxID=1214568 RepID=UPI0022FE5600|nr:uncharacterized protein J7T55_015530 [Diaporthe amygdali]KAJ0120795.1 hypothetical protein J7T55_015530 [Diaporthe amygdali]
MSESADRQVLSGELDRERHRRWHGKTDILRELLREPTIDPEPVGSEEEIFDVVIDTLGRELVKTVHFTLRLACRVGCLVLAKQLFRAAAHNPELRRKMLSIQENSQYSINNISQQKGSEAASSNHAGIVKFLCEQEGIEAYVRHIKTHNGYAVSHQTGENPNAEL